MNTLHVNESFDPLNNLFPEDNYTLSGGVQPIIRKWGFYTFFRMIWSDSHPNASDGGYLSPPPLIVNPLLVRVELVLSRFVLTYFELFLKSTMKYFLLVLAVVGIVESVARETVQEAALSARNLLRKESILTLSSIFKTDVNPTLAGQPFAYIR
jgi:hypothetical protein